MKEIILQIEGMMCEGCEKRVKNVISNIEGIKKVVADHTTGKVIIECNANIAQEEMERTLEDIGYTVVKDKKM